MTLRFSRCLHRQFIVNRIKFDMLTDGNRKYLSSGCLKPFSFVIYSKLVVVLRMLLLLRLHESQLSKHLERGFLFVDVQLLLRLGQQ
jgi:hypothetical protein